MAARDFKIYCKVINVCEGFIWRYLRPFLNRKNKYPQTPELTANIYPHEHGFVSKNANINPANINEFTIYNFMGNYTVFVRYLSVTHQNFHVQVVTI